MAIKSLAKGLFERVVLSGPTYALLSSRATVGTAASPAAARRRLQDISPRPEHVRTAPDRMPEPSVDVTVVVPVYNVEHYVGECLDSILAQELPGGRSLEVIAVNDGPTDGSAAIVRAIAARDRRLRVIEQENRGLSSARNAALNVARGRRMAFVDSDDALAPGHLAALLEASERTGAPVVSALWQRVAEDGTSLGVGEASRTNMAPWARLYRREVWERLRFPEGCWYEDLITPCCVQPLFSEAFVDDCGYRYRVRPGSIVESSSRNPKALDSYWALEELVGWRHDLGITYDQADLDRFVSIMGPTLMGRVTFLDAAGLRDVFTLCCELLASLDELRGLHTSRPGAWADVERALRTRSFSLWCLACAATASASKDVKLMTAWSYYRQSLRL